MKLTTRRRLLAGLAALALQGSVAAQERGEVPERSAAKELEYFHLAGTRDREAMRLGDEDVLVSVGTSEGGNNFRTSTPALMKSAGEVALVDREELRSRLFAMYKEGSTFSSAPRTHTLVTPESNWSRRRSEAGASGEAAAPEQLADIEASAWGWITPLLAFVLATLFVVRAIPQKDE